MFSLGTENTKTYDAAWIMLFINEEKLWMFLENINNNIVGFPTLSDWGDVMLLFGLLAHVREMVQILESAFLNQSVSVS